MKFISVVAFGLVALGLAGSVHAETGGLPAAKAATSASAGKDKPPAQKKKPKPAHKAGPGKKKKPPGTPKAGGEHKHKHGHETGKRSQVMR